MEQDNLITSTKRVLSQEVLNLIENKRFCIVGCGAVGSAFAEMLVRTGAMHLSLIDADCVQHKNLNRVIAFTKQDIGKKKVEVLKNRLMAINDEINISVADSFVRRSIAKDVVQAIELVKNSDYVLISSDTNESRIEVENICRDFSRIRFMSIGSKIEQNQYEYECAWMPKTSGKLKNVEGYGSVNGSFISIVMESVSVGFNMLLHHLEYQDSGKFMHVHKEYENHIPKKKEDLLII